MAEYLSQGKAILAERLLTDLPFQLQNKKHLLYFDDAKDCAKKAKQLINNQGKINYLSNNIEAGIKMGENGRKAVNEKYNWNNESKKLIELYNNIYSSNN